MSAVLLAVFNDYATADRVRTELVLDGFPTDRVDVTAVIDPGRAALMPGASFHDKVLRYFRSLFTREDERDFPEIFTLRVEDGAATVIVHPRGPVETVRATEILTQAEATQVARHALTDQAFEHAAARSPRPWVSHFWWESSSSDLCIYCRLFEHGPAADPPREFRSSR